MQEHLGYRWDVYQRLCQLHLSKYDLYAYAWEWCLSGWVLWCRLRTNSIVLCPYNINIFHSGDSGGPLIIPGNDTSSDVQIGVVSWGIGCARMFPGVYSRVSIAYDWIKETVCNVSSVPPNELCDLQEPTASPTYVPSLVSLFYLNLSILFAIKPANRNLIH